MKLLTTLLLSAASVFVATAEETALPHVPADSFVVPEGFEVTLWATSPMFYNPTNMDIDGQGRVWVAEGRNYRMFRNKDVTAFDPKGDRIMVLTDSNGDGKADKSHVFVQEPALVSPLGIAVIDNKIVVSQPPTLLVYTDVDRNAVFDPKIDEREVLLTGFGGHDHDHSLHSVCTGPSGQWYFNSGNAGTHIVKGTDGWTLRVGSVYKGGSPSVTEPGPNQGGQPGLKSDDGHIYVGSVALRMNPDGTGLRPIGHNMRNSYEETVTSFGDVFQNDNDDPPACRTTWLMEYGNLGFASDDGERKWQSERRPGQSAPIAEWRQEDPGTIPAGDVYGTGSPTGIAYYENGALSDKYQGLLLSGEPARNVVFGYLPVPDGAGFKLERFDFMRSKRVNEFKADARKKADFANKFRPSDVTVGADGAIYVADWFDNGVGGHRMSDKDLTGAIYRIAPKNKGKNIDSPRFDLATTAGQIAALKSPANHVRNAGFTRLKASGETAVPAVQALLNDSNPYIQARAIFLLAQLGEKGITQVESKLKSAENPQIRIACFRALRFVQRNLLAHAKALSTDPSIAVRREVALAMRNLSFNETSEIILTLARQYDGKDRWMLEALGTASANKEAKIYDLLHTAIGEKDPLKWSPAFANLAWRLHPEAAVEDFKSRALNVIISLKERKNAMTAIGFTPSKEAALAMVEIAVKGQDDTRTIAKFWLYNRGSNSWKAHTSLMKGLNKKANTLKPNQDYKVPTESPEITKLNVKAVLALQGDPARGKMGIARCYMCHQVNGTGIDFGPALDEWGRGRSLEAIATAIIDPNAGLAHGFEATEITTKKGHTIQGFSLFAGGSSILKVMGGGEISISRRDIKTIKLLDYSLMLSAGQLGLKAQEVADIVAFLKLGSPDTPKGAVQAVPKGKATPKSAAKKKANRAFKKSKPRRDDSLNVSFDIKDRKAGLTHENAPAIVWSGDKSKNRILFLAGSTTHNHGIHEYKAGALLLTKALNESGLPIEARVHWFNWPKDESCFEGVDACIVYADGGGSFGEKYAFLDAKYKKGMALMFMHYGVHPKKEIGEKYYKPWIGGYFDDGFSVNPTWIADMRLKDGHPVSRGLSGSVKAFDEFYWNLSFDKECRHCHPLASATPTAKNMVRYGSSKFWNKEAADKLGTEQALLWCRDPKNAPRGVGFVGGHYHRNWAIDDYRKLILNTITWLAKVDVPVNGVPSKKVTKEMLNANLNRPVFPIEVELPTADLLTQPGGKPPELGPDGRSIQKSRKKK